MRLGLGVLVAGSTLVGGAVGSVVAVATTPATAYASACYTYCMNNVCKAVGLRLYCKPLGTSIGSTCDGTGSCDGELEP